MSKSNKKRRNHTHPHAKRAQEQAIADQRAAHEEQMAELKKKSQPLISPPIITFQDIQKSIAASSQKAVEDFNRSMKSWADPTSNPLKDMTDLLANFGKLSTTRKEAQVSIPRMFSGQKGRSTYKFNYPMPPDFDPVFDSKGWLLQTSQLSLTKEGYLACDKCKSVDCKHIVELDKNPGLDIWSMQHMLEWPDFLKNIYLLPIRILIRQNLPMVSVYLAQKSDAYWVVKILSDSSAPRDYEYDLGYIDREVEGFVAIKRLVENFAEQMIGNPAFTCHSASHVRKRRDARLVDFEDAVYWLASNGTKCRWCVEYSEAVTADLVPGAQSDQNIWSKTNTIPVPNIVPVPPVMTSSITTTVQRDGSVMMSGTSTPVKSGEVIQVNWLYPEGFNRA